MARPVTLRGGFHWRMTGPETGAPLVLLHGFLGHGGDWAPVAEMMAGKGFRCLMPDLPGHGKTPLDPVMDWSGLIAALDAACLSVAPPPWRIAGYSMGGRIALQWALQYSGHAGGLVLESASPGLADVRERLLRAASDVRLAERLDQLRPWRGEDYGVFLGEWYAQPIFRGLEGRPGLLERVLHARRTHPPNHPGGALRAFGTGAQPSLWERLGELTCPVRVITGVLDEKFCGVARAMTARNPRIQHVVADTCGHMPHVERPDLFAMMLAETFLLCE